MTRDHLGELESAVDAACGVRPRVRVAAGGGGEGAAEGAAEGAVDCAVEFAVGPAPTGGAWTDDPAPVADGAVLRVRLDPAAAQDVEAVRAAASRAGARLRAAGGAVRVAVRAPASVPHDALADGLASGYPGTDLTLLVPEAHAGAVRAGVLTADAVRLARLLTSAPPNVLTPAAAAGLARRVAELAGLDCTVRTGEELAPFGAIRAIGQGSANPPALVELRYGGAADGQGGEHGGGERVALVGKGITFDSGGLSLKSPAAMQSMRMDCAGAAAVLAVAAVLPRLASGRSVHAVLPFAENLPGPTATRPGDVVTAWNGTQIQVLDTDFEGRVVLADALALAADGRPDLVVDLATLTYQAEIALGPQIGAVLGRDPRAVERVLAAAAAAGEPMWPLPWAERYLDQVRTASGVRNHPLHDSGRAITAALFLGEFVPPGVPWAHLDMAGPAWAGDASGDHATGFGVRTLLRLLA